MENRLNPIMATISLISKYCDGYSLATKLADEGHNVKFYVKDPRAKDTGKGLENPKQQLSIPSDSDLYLFDMVGLGSTAKTLGERGKVVLGGGLLNDKLELDRVYGQRVAALTKAKVPATEEFNDILSGLRYLQKTEKPQAFKPLGNKYASWTFISQENNEGLSSFMRNIPQKNMPFILQDTVTGVEVSTEGWFDGEHFVCFNHTFEKKRFMEGDKGPNTGCMGNLVWICNKDKLVQYLLLPLEDFLKKAGYIGPLDANCIVTPEEVYFLEWTARLGYDAIQALGELLDLSWFDFLYGISTGTLSKPKFHPYYSLAVRLSMPPYPNETASASHLQGLRVLDIPPQAKKHVWLSDVQYNGKTPALAGVDGVVGCVTAYGEGEFPIALREARRRVYRTIDNIAINPDLQFRQDIGSGWESDYTNLKTWGWV